MLPLQLRVYDLYLRQSATRTGSAEPDSANRGEFGRHFASSIRFISCRRVRMPMPEPVPPTRSNSLPGDRFVDPLLRGILWTIPVRQLSVSQIPGSRLAKAAGTSLYFHLFFSSDGKLSSVPTSSSSQSTFTISFPFHESLSSGGEMLSDGHYRIMDRRGIATYLLAFFAEARSPDHIARRLLDRFRKRLIEKDSAEFPQRTLEAWSSARALILAQRGRIEQLVYGKVPGLPHAARDAPEPGAKNSRRPLYGSSSHPADKVRLWRTFCW